MFKPTGEIDHGNAETITLKEYQRDLEAWTVEVGKGTMKRENLFSNDFVPVGSDKGDRLSVLVVRL